MSRRGILGLNCGVKQTLKLWAVGLVQAFMGMVFKDSVVCGVRDVYALESDDGVMCVVINKCENKELR